MDAFLWIENSYLKDENNPNIGKYIFHENEGTFGLENTSNYFSNKKFNYLNSEKNLKSYCTYC